MFLIPKSYWDKLEYEHRVVGRSCLDHEHNGIKHKRGERIMCLCYIPGQEDVVNAGSTLIFEHIHFEVIAG